MLIASVRMRILEILPPKSVLPYCKSIFRSYCDGAFSWQIFVALLVAFGHSEIEQSEVDVLQTCVAFDQGFTLKIFFSFQP